MAKVMAISVLDTFEILSVIAMMNPLITIQEAEAIKAKINLLERKPSSGEIGLATPFFRHLASPRMAEKQERKKESRRKAGVLYTSPFNNISNTTCRRLGLSGEKITF